ncbi:MAG: hypothetical protein ACRYGP_19680 [Janthinobacterium lividum]
MTVKQATKGVLAGADGGGRACVEAGGTGSAIGSRPGRSIVTSPRSYAAATRLDPGCRAHVD